MKKVKLHFCGEGFWTYNFVTEEGYIIMGLDDQFWWVGGLIKEEGTASFKSGDAGPPAVSSTLMEMVMNH